MGSLDAETETLLAFTSKDYGADAGPVSPTLRAMPHADSHPNSGGQVAIAIQERAVSENPYAGPQGAGWREDCAFTLEARHHVQAVAFHGSQDPDTSENVSHPVGRNGGRECCIAIEGCGYAVRRITPREAERLQGFPDDWTLIPTTRRHWHRNRAIMRAYLDPNGALSDDELDRLVADGPRYKAIGNSMAVPVMTWLLFRLTANIQVRA